MIAIDKELLRVAEPGENITELLSSDDVLAVVVFFFASSIMLMTFDSIHFCFLLDTAALTAAQYDILRILPHLGIALGSVFYLNWFSTIQPRVLTMVGLGIKLLLILATYFNV